MPSNMYLDLFNGSCRIEISVGIIARRKDSLWIAASDCEGRYIISLITEKGEKVDEAADRHHRHG